MTRDATPGPAPLPTPEEIAAELYPGSVDRRAGALAGVRADRDAVREALLAEANSIAAGKRPDNREPWASSKALRDFAARLGGSR